jgi:hypothetical protein
MATKLEQLDNLIRARAARLGKARDEIRRLEGELEGLLEARRALFAHEPKLQLPELPRARDLSAEWNDILCFILRRAPNPTSIDDVMQFIVERKFQIRRNAVRSQLHVYMNRGFLERVGDGLYLATDAVKPYC